ncbi:squalene/phytoene synthase family protein [Sphingomonas sp. Tas61C01]|uniref:squalene/phytoene synthase family protein n=1 Tax=Sphingomonas sp. Tas61C01 TaxID=3458297 RepID=UPI00403ED3AD
MAELRSEAQRLVLRHAPAGAREAVAVLFALDERLGDIVRSTREPLVGQMRLTWWRDALTALDERQPAPAEPVLVEVRRLLLPRGVSGAALAPMAEGWMMILHDGYASDGSLADYAVLRGGTLFAAAARVLGAAEVAMLHEAGRGWALGDLAANISSATDAVAVRTDADVALSLAFSSRWSKALRPIGLLALLMMLDADTVSAYVKIRRVLSFRMFGR